MAGLSGFLSSVLNLRDDRAADVEQAVNAILKKYGWTIVDGTGVGKIDRYFIDERSLGPSATENLDLAGGSLVNQFGPVTFVKMRALIVLADPTNLNGLEVSQPAAGVPLFGVQDARIQLAARGKFEYVDPNGGVVVTPTTADLIKLTNLAGVNTIKYIPIILGTSA